MIDAPQTGQKLDLTQAVQMLHWLDAEHRKDKLLVADLQEKIDGQKELIIHQGRRLEELEARLTKTQSTLYRFDQLESAMAQIRTETSALLPRFEHELTTALAQLTQMRVAERERDGRLIHELSVQLESLPGIERRLDTYTIEDRRLNDLFPPIQAKLEQLAAALAEQAARAQYLDTWGDRITAQIAELKQIEDRIKTVHATMSEQILRAEEEQRQQLSQWAREILEHRKKVDESLSDLPPLREAYNQVRQALAHLEGLDEEIRGEQAQVSHLLELREQRTHEILAEWRSEYDKNWEQYLTTFELYRKQQRELTDALTARIEALEQVDGEHAQRWAALREAWAEQSKRQVLEIARVQQELEASVIGKKRGL
ncbi:MAG: hypothetical protein HY259_06515 [Chloroflexi bacterium]|nr:hypothetical protein [Chloroflexota bacterium]